MPANPQNKFSREIIRIWFAISGTTPSAGVGEGWGGREGWKGRKGQIKRTVRATAKRLYKQKEAKQKEGLMAT